MSKGQTLIIDSADRSTGSAQDFEINLPNSHRATKIELLYTSIPLTEYTIHSGNKYIYYESSVDGPATTAIAEGFYDSSTFPAAVAAALNATAVLVTYTVTFSSLTGKLSVHPDVGNIQFLFSGTINSAAGEMGFSLQNTAMAASLTSDALMDLSPPRWLMLELSPALNEVVSSDNTSGTFLIPTGLNGLEIQNYHPMMNHIQFANSLDLRKLHVRLKKRGGDTYNMNGVNWSFAIKVYAE